MNFITVATLFTDNSNDVVFWGLMVSPTASRENTMYCFRRDNRNSIPLSRPCQTRATLHALVPVTRFAYPVAMWFPHTHPHTHTHIYAHTVFDTASAKKLITFTFYCQWPGFVTRLTKIVDYVTYEFRWKIEVPPRRIRYWCFTRDPLAVRSVKNSQREFSLGIKNSICFVTGGVNTAGEMIQLFLNSSNIFLERIRGF